VVPPFAAKCILFLVISHDVVTIADWMCDKGLFHCQSNNQIREKLIMLVVNSMQSVYSANYR
jgi:hypothetical protein